MIDMESKSHLKIWSAVAVALMLAVAVGPALASDKGSEAAEASQATIDIGKGMVWTWAPTFNLDDVVVSVYASASTFNSTTLSPSKYSQTSSGYATVTNGEVKVSIPSDYAGTNYYLAVRGTTTNPDQSVFYKITFKVSEYAISFDSDISAITNMAIEDLIPAVTSKTGTTVTGWSIDKALPAGLSFDASTGKISGTPTAASAATEYTVTAVMQPPNGPGFSVSTTVTIAVSDPTSVSTQNYTVYAIKGTTKITVPTIGATGTVTTTVSKNGASATSAGTSYIGLTISATTGKITGKPSAAGTYVFHQTLTGTSTGSRDVTVVVEEKIATSNTENVYSIQGTASTFETTQTAGPANVTWTIKSLKYNGATVSDNLVSGYGISVDSHGNLKTSASTPAGTYEIVLNVCSADSTATTAGATGTSPANNKANPTYTLVVAPELMFTNSPSASCEITGASA